MTTKLTLSIEKNVIRKAKNYAYKNGRSLSQVVQQYLESITEEKSTDKLEIPEKLKKLHGVAKIPLSLDNKKEIRKILSSKE